MAPAALCRKKEKISRCLLKMKQSGISSLQEFIQQQQVDGAEGLFTDYSYPACVLFSSTAEVHIQTGACRADPAGDVGASGLVHLSPAVSRCSKINSTPERVRCLKS